MIIRSMLRTGLSLPLSYGYVRKKDLNAISSEYKQDTMWQKTKMYGAMALHIFKNGVIQAKKDIFLFLQLRKKTQLTTQQTYLYIRLKHDFHRCGPLVIIQILPFTGVFYFMYLYTYPGSIPSWFIDDQTHQQHEAQLRDKQKDAIQFFNDKDLEADELDYSSLSLKEARKLSELFFGYYGDGTIGLNKFFKWKLQYLISEGMSKYLIKRNIKFKFRQDLFNAQILGKMNFNQKLRWKFERVMKGELMPPLEDTLSEEELKARGKDKD